MEFLRQSVTQSTGLALFKTEPDSKSSDVSKFHCGAALLFSAKNEFPQESNNCILDSCCMAGARFSAQLQLDKNNHFYIAFNSILSTLLPHDFAFAKTRNEIKFYLYLYLLHLYPGFYSYTEGATWKILDLLTETLLI